MSTTNTVATKACGSCGEPNESNSQFCSSCGKSLWDKCGNCDAQTWIGTRFCSSCGFDLEAAVTKRNDDVIAKIEAAKKTALEGKLDLAIKMLERLTSIQDHRLQPLVEQAGELRAKFQNDLSKWAEVIAELPTKAQSLLKSTQYQEAANLFDGVPASLLDEHLTRLQEEANEKLSRSTTSKKLLNDAVEKKQWSVAIFELAQLQQLYPDKEKYSTLAVQISKRLLKQSQGLSAKGDYSEALEALDAIPENIQTDNVRKFRDSIEQLIFLRKLVATTPIAYPLVGAAIDRIAQLTPQDEKTASIRKKFDVALKKDPKKSFLALPAWLKQRGGTYETSILPATLPRTIRGSRPAAIAKAGTRFWTAYGMALQGIGKGDETANFLKAEKSGLMGFLGGKKKKQEFDVAWGIDIGDSAIKAVRLRNAEKGVEIDEAVLFQIDDKDGDNSAPKTKKVFKVLEKVLADKAFKEVPVVSNVPSSDLLARYLELPADKPAQHQTFVEQEAAANIPIAADLLQLSHLTFDKEHEGSVSQNSMLLALRKSEIEARASMFNQLGVELTALVAEPIANSLALKQLNYLDELNEENEAILMLDVGSFRSTVEVISRIGSWYRTIDWGIENLNQHLASGLKVTKAEADSLRRNPMGTPSVVATTKLMREACLVPVREIERSVRAAQDVLGKTEIVCPILVGGGAYQPLLGSLLNSEPF